MPALNGKERKALREALGEAFQSYDALRRMSLDQLDFNLNSRTDASAGVVTAADHLIEEMDEGAGRQGVVRLIEAARAERPMNPALREFERKFMNTADPFGDVHPTVGVAASIATRAGLERVIVDAAGLPPSVDVMSGLGAAEYRVCYIGYPLPSGKTVYGTGFLVSDDLVMTNHHVISPAVQSGLPGQAVDLTFGWRSRESKVARYRLVSSGWLAVSDEALDYAILRVDGQPGADPPVDKGTTPRGCLKLVAETPGTDEPLIILQHPYDKLEGGPATLRLTIGFVLQRAEAQAAYVIRHSANTDEGSSGSPVFTGRADLIALHNWGGPKHNEAIRVGTIREHLVSSGHGELLG